MAEYSTITNGHGLTTLIVLREGNSPVLFAYDESADYDNLRTQLELQGTQSFADLLATNPDNAFLIFTNFQSTQPTE